MDTELARPPRWQRSAPTDRVEVLALATELWAASLGWALVAALEEQGLTRLALPVLPLLVVTVGAAGAGVLAAVQPSRRAARLDVLRAIGAE